MKRNVVLLIDADADTASSVLEAAGLANLDVRFARTSCDLFQLTQTGLDDVAVIALDVDPGAHGMAILEALDAWGPAPPVIVISSLEETYVRPIALAHGATECFGKPVRAECLRTAIEKLSQIRQEPSRRCDRWGHLCEDCDESREIAKKHDYAFFAEKH